MGLSDAGPCFNIIWQAITMLEENLWGMGDRNCSLLEVIKRRRDVPDLHVPLKFLFTGQFGFHHNFPDQSVISQMCIRFLCALLRAINQGLLAASSQTHLQVLTIQNHAQSPTLPPDSGNSRTNRWDGEGNFSSHYVPHVANIT